MAIAHPQQFKNDIWLSSRRCYGCIPLLHLRFAGLSSDIIWSGVPEKCRPLPEGRPGRHGGGTSEEMRFRWASPDSLQFPPSRRSLTPALARLSVTANCAHGALCCPGADTTRVPAAQGSHDPPRVIAETPGTGVRSHLHSWVPWHSTRM